MKNKKVIIGIIVVFLVLLIIVKVFGGKNNSTSNSNKQSEPEITVISTELVDIDEPLSGPEKYLKVRVSIKNPTNEKMMIDGANITNKDGEKVSNLAIYVEDEEKLKSEIIDAKETYTGNCYFKTDEIPDSMIIKRLTNPRYENGKLSADTEEIEVKLK